MNATALDDQRSTTGETPGPRGNPVFGSMHEFERDKLGFVRGPTRYGDVARYRIAHPNWCQVNHPGGARRVLQEDNRNPRQCIGHGMALVEARLVLVTVLKRCRLRPFSDRPAETQALATLRPRGGLPMIPEPV